MSPSGPSAISRLVALPDDARTLGPFRLVKQLGKGGFAPVWLAKEVYGDSELRTVAVKLFAAGERAPASGSDRAKSEARAQRDLIVQEARALCRVEHPNVVRFYALTPDAEGTVLGLVMEYVRGTSLDRRLEEVKRLPVAEALAVGQAIAWALAAVHAAGLVHRDVKPGNVVESEGVYKLIDFGIAAAGSGASTPKSGPRKKKAPVVLDDLPLEAAGTRSLDGGEDDAGFAGTLGYVDPISVRTLEAATPASDIYALGATLFECLTGSLPAVAASVLEGKSGLKGEVLDGRARAPSVRALAPELDAPLATLIDALLDPDPAKRPRSAELVAWELERIRREIGGRAPVLPPESVGPFRGLERFESGDRDVYFGRSAEVAATLEMLRSRGLAALVGPSGSGKSSLARAGVLPAITDGELGGWPRAWDSAVVSPGVDAKAAIVAALGAFVPKAKELGPEALVAALSERALSEGRGLVLVVDQLEELATQSSAEGRAFGAELLGLLGRHPRPGVRALVAVRRDMLNPVLALHELGRAVSRGTVLVDAISDATWIDVVDRALALYGYSLEDEAMRKALREELKATSGAMPLVQFALTQLWERRDEAKKTIPRAALEAIGGIAGGLEMHADATLAELAALGPETGPAAREVLLALTTAEGTRATRRLAEIEELVPGVATEKVLRALEKARLVVRERGLFSLSHEALLVQWGTLRAWVAEARSDRLLVDELEREVEAWEGRRDPERLWKGRRLLAAEELAERGEAMKLSPSALAFVRAGRGAERKGRAKLASGALVLATVAAMSGGFYVRLLIVTERARTAEAQTHLDEAQQRADAAQKQAKTSGDAVDREKARAVDAEKKAAESTAALVKARADADDLKKELARRPAPIGSVKLGPVEVR